MSATSTRMPAREAARVAASFIAKIADVVDRVEVAGSLRRRLPTCGDIEICAVSKHEQRYQRDMFGEVVEIVDADLLAARLTSLLKDGLVSKRETNGRGVWGSKHKRLSFDSAPIDLFCCDAERWGVILAIRTGPHPFSHQLVTERGKTVVVGTGPNGRPITREGLLPKIYRVQDGWLTYRVSGERIPTPTEEALFELLRLRAHAPWERV